MKFLLILLLFFWNYSFSQITYPEKGWIQSLQEYTVSLGDVKKDTVTHEGKKKVFPYYNIIGTGVTFYVKFQGHVVPVIVTAKHVLLDENNRYYDSIKVRFSWHDNKSVYSYFGVSIPLRFDNELTVFQHPDSTIDLACFPLLLNSATKDSVKSVPYSFFPDDYQIFEGAEVYVLGYPGSVGKNYWTRALLRKSIISWAPENLSTKKFLIDCNVFPGNSGGPVFTKKPEFPILKDTSDYSKLFKFLGIVVERRFNYNKLQRMKDGRLNPIKDAEGFTLYSPESIGVGVVEPAKNVLSLLKLFEMAINQTK